MAMIQNVSTERSLSSADKKRGAAADGRRVPLQVISERTR
jgi:hypothetical protein